MEIQEQLRKKLNTYLRNTGIKVRHICKKTGLNETTLCKFRKNRNLNTKNFNLLKKYFKE